MQSWVLAGVTQASTLRDTLLFKGGMILRKCYFGAYRFSEGLDFSALGEVAQTAEEYFSPAKHNRLVLYHRVPSEDSNLSDRV